MNNDGKRGNCANGEGNACCKVRRNCNISLHDATHGYNYATFVTSDRCIDRAFLSPSSVSFSRTAEYCCEIIRIDSSERLTETEIETRTETTLFKRITFNWQFSVLSLYTANVYPGLLHLYSRVSIFARDYSTPALHSPLFFYVQENCI